MSDDAEPPDAPTPTSKAEPRQVREATPSPAPDAAGLEQLEQLRRSPHPYHRRKDQQTSEESSTSFFRTSLDPTDRTSSDADGRKRRKLSPSSSASGTEADDEGYSFVKALPAPPLRPRKGLRDVRGSGLEGEATPLLTPSQVDEEGRRYSAEFFKAKQGRTRGGTPSATDEEARAAREKYRRRRRNELIRRTTETALLGAIGVLAVWGCCCWKELLNWHRELFTFVLAMGCLLALYPVRLFLYSRRQEPNPKSQRRPWLRVPSAFDPANILYPTILPILISISLYPSLEKILLPNIILGLAAMPPRLIPQAKSGAGYSELHWLLSTLPLFASEHTDIFSKVSAEVPYKLKLPPPEKGLHPEILVCLFALHQALLPPLHYLTTTSLLPTELQLLSVGLINLLLFATSPQAVILKTLLWVGGLGLFILCGKVLKWGVALARIPRWRFRRAVHIARTQQSFINTLMSKRSQSATGRLASDSDTDGDDVSAPILLNNPLKKTKHLTLNMLTGTKSSATANGTEPKSAVEPGKPAFPSTEDPASNAPKRRVTLSTLPSQENTNRRRKRAQSTAKYFLSLTHRQAQVRKWLYAVYFYLIVVALILGPIRHIIQHYALNGHEPFGWAIGYLFGNIQPLRFQVFSWNLGGWISLPPLLDSSTSPPSLGFVAPQLVDKYGAANVRLALIAYDLGVVFVGLTAVLSLPALSPEIEVDTRRKIFHFTITSILFPTVFIDPAFVALALALVLAIFLLLDLIRASQLPPLSRYIAVFLTPYVDGRDLRGPVVVSHIFLLIGCAVPLWLSLAGVGRTGGGIADEEPWKGWVLSSQDRSVDMLAGVICVGMGDAAASLIGRRFGRRKWPWAGGKSLEGSAAFAVAVTVGLVAGKIWLRAGGWQINEGGIGGVGEWMMIGGKAMLCAMGASLNEAVLTGGNDNVVVPVLLWVLVKGVRL